MKQMFEISDSGVLSRYRGREAHVCVPEGVREIEHSAFRGCGTVTELTLPRSLEGRSFAEMLEDSETVRITYIGYHRIVK